jgi:TRAP-type mannitol/chloroaromatic compound transport system substrate-binding protein
MNLTRISVIASIAAAAAAIHAASARPAYSQSKPDLVVLIAVDQFSASLLTIGAAASNPGSNVSSMKGSFTATPINPTA